MGVMHCSRNGCENKTSRSIGGVGYLCKECEEDFKSYIREEQAIETDGQIKNELIKFIFANPKGNYGNNKMTVNEFFLKNSYP